MVREDPLGSNAPQQREEEAIENTATNIDIHATVHAIMLAFVEQKTVPLELCRQLDDQFTAYQQQSESQANGLVDQTARQLFQQQELFQHLNFQSSLLNRQSSFFHAVVGKMASILAEEPEYAELAPGPVLVRAVEANRRSEKYDEMSPLLDRVHATLDASAESGEAEANRWLGSAMYEVSMAHYQQGQIDEAIVSSQKAARYSKTAKHGPGQLQAVGNIGGLFYSAKGGKWLEEGRKLCEKVLEQASQGLEQAANDDLLRQQYARVQMNSATHLLQLESSTEKLKEYLAILDSNEIFAPARNADWAIANTAAARERVAGDTELA